MSELELVLEKAERCVSPQEIAELVTAHQNFFLRTALDKHPEMTSERRGYILGGRLDVSAANFWAWKKNLPGWQGVMNLRFYPTGMGFGHIAADLLSPLPLTVKEDRDQLQSVRQTVILKADDWRQMLAYRRLMGIDSSKI